MRKQLGLPPARATDATTVGWTLASTMNSSTVGGVVMSVLEAAGVFDGGIPDGSDGEIDGGAPDNLEVKFFDGGVP